MNKITTYGSVLTRENDVIFDFSYSGIEFKATENVTVEIEVIPSDILKRGRVTYMTYAYLEISINGAFSKTLRIKPDSESEMRKISIEANQTVRIMKLSEAYMGTVCFKNILSLPIESIPKEEKIKVEFIGDSLTSGYGNDGPNNSVFDTDWKKAWGYYLCERYNWEPLVHSYSCMGLVRDSSYVSEEQIDERRRRVVGSIQDVNFDFSTFKASYVFINIGTNDFGGVVQIQLKNKFHQKFVDLINEIVGNYGEDVKIILVHGPMMNEKCRNVIREVPNLFNDNPEMKEKIFVTDVYLDEEKHYGPYFHPTGDGHKVMAEQLIPQIDKIVKK